MSTLTAPTTTSTAPTTGLRARLIATTLSHTIVDFFSFIIVPLLTVFKGKLDLSDREAATLVAIGGLTSGLIQPLVAWLTDRFDTRLLGTLGVLVAVIAVGFVGYAPSFPVLILLQIVAAAGIGAFHPVAAAAMGHLSGHSRSFGLAVFYCAGMIGGVAGNFTAPQYVKHFGNGVAVQGLPSLVWLIIPGVVCVAFLAWAIHGVAHRHHEAHAQHAALPATERRRRWRAVGQLYFSNVLRFGTDSATFALIIRWTESLSREHFHITTLDETARTYSAGLNGPLQAAKQIGMGLGGIALSWLIRRGGAGERRVMIGVPLLALITIPLVPHTTPAVGFVLMVIAGVGFGSLVAPTIALAQRLLPHRTGLASGLMMGGAWAVGVVLAPIADALVDAIGLNLAFAVIASLCLISSILAAALPRDLLHATR